MNDFAIRTEKISKLYFIGGNREKYRTLRDSADGRLATRAGIRRVCVDEENRP